MKGPSGYNVPIVAQRIRNVPVVAQRIRSVPVVAQRIRNVPAVAQRIRLQCSRSRKENTVFNKTFKLAGAETFEFTIFQRERN